MIRKLSSVNVSIPVVLFLMIAMVSITSCTKVATPAAANAKFLGKWVGSISECYTTAGAGDTTFTPSELASTVSTIESIGAGSSNNSLIIGVAFGVNTCYKATIMNASVNNYLFSIPTQTFTDNCNGITYLIGGDGSLSTGGVLTMNYNLKVGGDTLTTCVFTGTLQ